MQTFENMSVTLDRRKGATNYGLSHSPSLTHSPATSESSYRVTSDTIREAE